MRMPSQADAYQVLLLQAADDGRGPVLFGECLGRAREVVRPFFVSEKFPSVYLEHPLAGRPFLDVTLLYSELAQGARVASGMAAGTGAMLDWFAGIYDAYSDGDADGRSGGDADGHADERVERHAGKHAGICCGFEIDVKDASLPAAAVHFQPRSHTELVGPFCAAVGEPQRAGLYLSQAARMPQGWPLSFFGMFRGRPGSPLRVCGYLGADEVCACAEDARLLAARFDEIGFSAYDDAMLAQVAQLMGVTSKAVDFQFDIYPDGRLGDVFAIDVQFGIEQPEAVRASFADGRGARVMGLLEQWGAADERWRLAAQAAFARALPVQLDDGTIRRYAFTLMPQWAKARWSAGVLQPSKLYHLAHAGLLE